MVGCISRSVVINYVWGIHLTGPTLDGPPRSVRPRTFQARRASTLGRWYGSYFAGAPAGDEIPIAHLADSQLEHAIEHHTPAARAAAVEAEHELVEVADQVGVVDGALVSPQEPTLGQRGYAMYGGQQLVGIIATSALGALAAPFMFVAELRQSLIGRPPVGDDRPRVQCGRSRSREGTGPTHRPEARFGNGQDPLAPGAPPRFRSAPSCLWRGLLPALARPRRCRSRPPGPSRSATHDRGVPTPTAAGAASPMRSDTSRSPALVSINAEIPSLRWRTASTR